MPALVLPRKGFEQGTFFQRRKASLPVVVGVSVMPVVPMTFVPMMSVVLFMMPFSAATLMVAGVMAFVVVLTAAAFMIRFVVTPAARMIAAVAPLGMMSVVTFVSVMPVVFFVPVVMIAVRVLSGLVMAAALGGQMLCHGFFVKSLGRALDDHQRPFRAAADTCAKAVAEVVGDNLCLAVHNLDGPFSAIQNTLPAPCAQLFIYLYDITNHFHDILHPYR